MALTAILTRNTTASAAINTTAAWTVASAPTSTTVGGWISTSAAASTVTANFTMGAVLLAAGTVTASITTTTFIMTLNGVNDAGTNVLWEANTGSTFTVGSYIDFPNSGTIRLGTQQLNLANVISGSGTLTLTTTNVAGNLFLSSLKTTMTNPLVLAGGRLFGTTGANPFGTSPTFGSITVAANASQASEVRISPSAGSGQSLAFGNPFNINGNVTFGDAVGYTSTVTASGAITVANTPTLTVHAPTTFSNSISGSGGFQKNGANQLTINAQSTALTGTVTVLVGTLATGAVNANTGVNLFPAFDGYTIDSGAQVTLYASNNAVAYTIPTLSGAGTIFFTHSSTATSAANGITFNDMTGFTGLMTLWANQLTANQRAFASIKKFPSAAWTLQFSNGAGAAISTQQMTVTIPTDATASTTPAAIQVINSGFNTTGWLMAIYANQSTGAMNFSGTVKRTDSNTQAASLPLTLGGSSSALNTISGIIQETISTASLGITKVDGGTWVLTAANTHTGSTTVSAGKLRVDNPLALQLSTVILAGGTLEFNYPTINNAQIGHLRGSGNLALPGTDTNNVSDFTLTLGGNNEDNTASGREYSGVISGSGNIIKVGTSDIRLSGNNTFKGTVTINGTGRNPAIWGSIWVGQNGASGNLGDANNTVILTNNGSLGMYRTGTLTVAKVSGTGWLWSYGTGSGSSTLEVLSIDDLSGPCTISTSTSSGATYIGNIITTNNINDVGNITLAGTPTVGTWTKRGSKAVTVVGGAGVMNITVEGTGTLNVTGALTSTSGRITIPSTATFNAQANISKPMSVSGNNITFGPYSFTSATTSINYFGNEAVTTKININTGTTISQGMLYLSTQLNSSAAIYMTGGTLSMTNTGANYSYLNSTAGNAYAYLRMSGGTFQSSDYLIWGGFNATTNDNSAVMEVTGPVTWNTNYMAIGYGSGTGATTGYGSYMLHLRGGPSAPATVTILWLGESGGSGNQYAAITLENTPLTVTNSYLVFNTTDNSRTSVNSMAFLSVKGTTLSVPNVEANTTPGIYAITLSDSSTLTYTGGASAYHDAGVPVILFGDNNISVTGSSTAVAFSGTLVTASGQGVGTIPVATPGSGYIGTPVVRIIRDATGTPDTTGRGATARAVVDLDTASPTYGQLLSVVVVSGGHRYTKAPLVSLVGGIGVGGVAATLGTPTMSDVTTGGGFNKTSAGRFSINATSSELTGPVTLTGGILSLGQGTFVGNPLPGVTQYNLPNPNSTTEYRYISIQPNTGAFSYLAGTTFSGSGCISIASNLAYTAGATTPGTVFPAGAFTTAGREFNGNGTVMTSGLYSATAPSPASGLDLYLSNTTQYNSTTVTLNDLPTRVSFSTYAPLGSGNSYLKFVGNNPPPFTGTSVDFIASSSDATLVNFTNNIAADQTSGALIIGNGSTATFKRWGMNTAGQPTTLQLRGGSTANNEIRANISEERGVLRINKTDAGKWWLTGNNTYTGDTRVIQGTLVVGSEFALGKTPLDWYGASATSDTGTIDWTSSGLTTYTIGALKASAVPNRGAFTVPAGMNLKFGGYGPLPSSAPFTFSAVLAAQDNTATITFTGGAYHAITNSANTFNGTLAVENGASAVSSVTTYSGTTTYSTTTSPLASVQNILVSGAYIGTTYSTLWDLLISTTSQTIATNITVNDDAVYGMIHYGPSGATGYTSASYPTTYTGTISGTGWFAAAAFAYGGAVLNTSRLVEARSSTLPAGLWLNTNSYTNGGRWVNYGYLGPARADGSNFLSKGIRVDISDSSGLFGHAFIHRGTGSIVIAGGVDKKSGSITTGGNTAATLIFDNTDATYTGNQDITIQGVVKNTDTGVLNIQKNGNHDLTLSGLNTFGGSITISAGTVTCAAGNNVASGLGGAASTGAIALAGGTLEFYSATSSTVNRSAAQLQLTTTPTIKNILGANEFKVSTVTLGATTTFNTVAGTLTLTNTTAIPAATTAISITKTGVGTLKLNHVGNLYVGPTVIQQGTVEVIKLAGVGAASSLGQPALAQATLTMGANGDAGIKFSGTGLTDSTDRSINFVGGTGTTLTLDSSSVVANAIMNLTSGGTLSFTGAGTHTLRLTGTNSGASFNLMGRVIPDGASGATSLLADGTNKWQITAVPTYTGVTTVSSGATLDFNGQTLTLGNGLTVSGTGTILQNGTGVLTLLASSALAFSGTPVVTANLAGTGLTVGFTGTNATTNSIKISPQAGNNTGLAGTATISSGTRVTLTTETITATANGDVLGSLNLTVSAGGNLQIPTGISQRGRCRYKGTLTIAGTLKIGGTY